MPECAVAQRNEKVAAALGISADRQKEGRNQEVKYAASLQSFAKANQPFLATVEKSMYDFITSDKRIITLPHMPLPKRQFVRNLAEVYRLDGEDVDQEPRRSVQLRRRIDSRIPNPLLSAVIAPTRVTSVNSATTGSASSGPVKMAWGQRPVATAATAAATARPSSSNSMAWTAAAAKPTPLSGTKPVTSRPQTPQAAISKPPSPVPASRLPGNTAVVEDVPDSWDELAE